MNIFAAALCSPAHVISQDREKQEKKAAKAEKEKREKEAQDKSRSILAKFFGKAKAVAPNRSSSVNKDNTANVAGPSAAHSEFGTTFKSFVLKKDTELAPANWFQHAMKHRAKAKQKVDGDVIVLDDFNEVEDVEMKCVQHNIDVDASIGTGMSSVEGIHQQCLMIAINRASA